MFFDTVDLHKHCNEKAGKPFLPSGVMVDYHRCKNCGFIFTRFFDAFTMHDFEKMIYNDDYITVDPLYPEIRPRSNAAFLRNVTNQCCLGECPPRILDYGAGNGKLREYLSSDLDVTNYDPLNALFNVLPKEKYDIVFSSEVIEHVPEPKVLMQDWCNVLHKDGVVLFSTMLQPPDIMDVKASWWYISPRNGHISIFSSASLNHLCEQNGLQYRSISNEWHICFYQHGAPTLDFLKLQQIVDQLPTGFVVLD